MKILLSSAVFLIALACSAQDTAKTNIYTKVEIEAEFPGGRSAWARYLNKHLNYPEDARGNLIQGTVVVQFIVDGRTGKVSDIHAISGPESGGLREEAVRLISKSGVWIMAIMNGHQVSSYKKVPIEFKLDSN
jgi:protein TonB